MSQKRTVTLNGKSYNIAFNLATEMAYEDITGVPFNPSVIFVEKGKTPKLREIANVIAASIIANNEDAEFNPTEELLHNGNREEINAAAQTVVEAAAEWFFVPPTAEKHVKKAKKSEKEDAEKN